MKKILSILICLIMIGGCRGFYGQCGRKNSFEDRFDSSDNDD